MVIVPVDLWWATDLFHRLFAESQQGKKSADRRATVVDQVFRPEVPRPLDRVFAFSPWRPIQGHVLSIWKCSFQDKNPTNPKQPSDGRRIVVRLSERPGFDRDSKDGSEICKRR